MSLLSPNWMLLPCAGADDCSCIQQQRVNSVAFHTHIDYFNSVAFHTHIDYFIKCTYHFQPKSHLRKMNIEMAWKGVFGITEVFVSRAKERRWKCGSQLWKHKWSNTNMYYSADASSFTNTVDMFHIGIWKTLPRKLQEDNERTRNHGSGWPELKITCKWDLILMLLVLNNSKLYNKIC